MRTCSLVSSWSRSPAKQLASKARSPDRCIRGAVGSRRGDRPSSLGRRAVATQSASWVGSACLVLVGAAFGELALWVVRWWVSVGVRLVADATRWFNVENVRGTLRPGWTRARKVPAGSFGDWVEEKPITRPRMSRSADEGRPDRKSTRLNSSHANISYAVFCLKK